MGLRVCALLVPLWPGGWHVVPGCRFFREQSVECNERVRIRGLSSPPVEGCPPGRGGLLVVPAGQWPPTFVGVTE